MDTSLAFIGMFAFLAFLIFNGAFFTVQQQSMAILERLGRFSSIRGPGLHFKIPFVDKVSGKMSLKVRQLDVNVETKTKDNVFVKLKVGVQYVVGEDSVYDAFYKLANPDEQINSYIFDVVRAEVPKMKLDDVFERKDDIANAIKSELQEAMDKYGYRIGRALVTDIDPDATVKSAMNRINAAERGKLAAEYEGEADRIRIVAKAKAEAEADKPTPKNKANAKAKAEGGGGGRGRSSRRGVGDDGIQMVCTFFNHDGCNQGRECNLSHLHICRCPRSTQSNCVLCI